MNEPFKLFVTNYRETHVSGVDAYEPIETEDLTDIDGLMVQFTGCQPPAAVLYSSPFAGANGANYNSGRLNTRNIVLTFSLLSNQEANRLRIYSLFRTGGKVRLEFITYRRAYIEGFVETITENRFKEGKKQTLQVSIICFDPLFKAVESNKYTNTGKNLHWTINYGGDVPFGVKIKISFSGNCMEPFFKNNSDDVGSWGGIKITEPNYDHFSAGDTMYINTIDGQKEVYLIDSNNNKINLLNKILQPIGWFKALPRENEFATDSTTGAANMTAEIELIEVYEGI